MLVFPKEPRKSYKQNYRMVRRSLIKELESKKLEPVSPKQLAVKAFVLELNPELHSLNKVH